MTDEPSSPLMTKKREWVSFDPDPDYWKSLGRFIEAFASTEALLFSLLAFYAKVDNDTAKAVFSGARSDVCMNNIRRIIAMKDPAKDRRDELEYVFEHLTAISSARNDVVHYPSFVTSDAGRIVSNISRMHLVENIKERPISATALDQMVADLHKISMHFILHRLLPDVPLADRAKQEPVLSAAWQYTPPQDHEMKVNKPTRQGPRR
jgi:hypothetical protein